MASTMPFDRRMPPCTGPSGAAPEVSGSGRQGQPGSAVRRGGGVRPVAATLFGGVQGAVGQPDELLRFQPHAGGVADADGDGGGGAGGGHERPGGDGGPEPLGGDGRLLEGGEGQDGQELLAAPASD